MPVLVPEPITDPVRSLVLVPVVGSKAHPAHSEDVFPTPCEPTVIPSQMASDTAIPPLLCHGLHAASKLRLKHHSLLALHLVYHSPLIHHISSTALWSALLLSLLWWSLLLLAISVSVLKNDRQDIFNHIFTAVGTHIHHLKHHAGPVCAIFTLPSWQTYRPIDTACKAGVCVDNMRSRSRCKKGNIYLSKLRAKTYKQELEQR